MSYISAPDARRLFKSADKLVDLESHGALESILLAFGDVFTLREHPGVFILKTPRWYVQASAGSHDRVTLTCVTTTVSEHALLFEQANVLWQLAQPIAYTEELLPSLLGSVVAHNVMNDSPVHGFSTAVLAGDPEHLIKFLRKLLSE